MESSRRTENMGWGLKNIKREEYFKSNITKINVFEWSTMYRRRQ